MFRGFTFKKLGEKKYNFFKNIKQNIYYLNLLQACLLYHKNYIVMSQIEL